MTINNRECLYVRYLSTVSGLVSNSSMRSLLLLAMLLCVWCVAQVQTQDNTNTLRLCGRAFVRAVVYTCGGSRWKRLTGEQEALPGGQYSHLNRWH